MLEFILQAEGIVAAVSFVVCLLLTFYAQFRAAANRSLGVSWWTAQHAYALTFPDSTYTPVGKRWCRVWRYSVLGAIVSLPLFFVVGHVTIWIFKSLGLPLGDAVEAL